MQSRRDFGPAAAIIEKLHTWTDRIRNAWSNTYMYCGYSIQRAVGRIFINVWWLVVVVVLSAAAAMTTASHFQLFVSWVLGCWDTRYSLYRLLWHVYFWLMRTITHYAFAAVSTNGHIIFISFHHLLFLDGTVLPACRESFVFVMFMFICIHFTWNCTEEYALLGLLLYPNFCCICWHQKTSNNVHIIPLAHANHFKNIKLHIHTNR